MPAVNAADLAALRDQFQWSKFYLGVLKPATVHTSRINYPSMPRGTLVIPFDGGAYATGFTVANIHAGMTLWVGSTAGAHDICKLRIRTPYNRTCTAGSAYSTADGGITGTITVCEHNYLLLDNYYLTIKEEFKLWPKHPISVGGLVNTVWYMDYDVQYCNQNRDANRAPIVRMGPPGVAIRDAAGNATINFWSDSGAAPGGNAPATYAWTFRGGTPATAATAGTAAVPHAVTWTTPGFYLVGLTATTAGGVASTGYRPVFIYDSIDTNHKPYEAFEVENLGGDFDTGGWRMTVRVKQECAEADFPEESMIIIWAEDWYKGSKVSIGGNYRHRENLIFVGHITKETVHKDPFTDDVLFEAHTIDGEMKNCEEFAISLDDDPTAADHWCQIEDMTMDKVAYHILKWRSTLLDITDVYFSDDTMSVRWSDITQKSLYEQIDKDCYDATILGRCLSDRMSLIRCEKNPQFITSTATRNAIATIMDVQSQDWRNEIEWPSPQSPTTSMVDLSGVYYAGNLADTVPMFSLAYGDVMMERGRSTEKANLVLASQVYANRTAGNYIANLNNPYPNVRVPIGLNYRVFDIAPQEWVTMSLATTDTFRGTEWTSERLIPREIGFNLENAIGALNVDLGLEMESSGTAGVTGWYPVTPPEDDYTPPVTPVPPPWTPVLDDWDGIWIVLSYQNGVYRTTDLGASPPVWATWNTGLDLVSYSVGVQIERDPWHPSDRTYALFNVGGGAHEDEAGRVLYRRVYSGGAWGSWTVILNETIIETTLGFAVDANPIISRFTCNINAEGHIYALISYHPAAGGLCTTLLFKSANYGTTWSVSGIVKQDASIIPWGNFVIAGMLKGTSAYGAGSVLYCGWRSAQAGHYQQNSVSTDQGATWQAITQGFSIDNGIRGFPDPNDQSIFYGQIEHDVNVAGPVRKWTSHGLPYPTWTTLAAFGNVTRAPVCKVGGAASMVAASTTVLKISTNSGTTVTSKAVTGNIAGGGLILNWDWMKLMAHRAGVNGAGATFIFQVSPDGGTTWINKTGNLPNTYLANIGFHMDH